MWGFVAGLTEVREASIFFFADGPCNLLRFILLQTRHCHHVQERGTAQWLGGIEVTK